MFLGYVELAFLGHPLESVSRVFDPILTVVAIGRKQPDHLVSPARGRTGHVAGRKIDALTNVVFMLQRLLPSRKNVGRAHGFRCNGLVQTRQLYSTAPIRLASYIDRWQIPESCMFSAC